MLQAAPVIVAIFQLLFYLIPVGQTLTWEQTDSLCSSGRRQSPINIETIDVDRIYDAQPFVFINYDEVTLKPEVDDHTIKLIPVESNLDVGIAAGGLRGFFVLDHVHFHWESEHTTDKNRFPLEAHFVHYNTLYPNLSQALADPTGVAVIGVLFTEGTKSSGIAALIDNIENRNNNELTPSQFLPMDLNKFFRYHGSLTTKPCSESVIWTIYKSKVSLSTDQITWFKRAKLENGPVEENYRTIQPTGDRIVELWLTSKTNGAYINKIPPCYLCLFIITFMTNYLYYYS